MPEDTLESRERCPTCGGSLVVESEDPLEEYCVEPSCEYYRAEGADGQVIRE